MRVLCRQVAAFPALVFCVFDMNGADDVVKYCKWESASAENRMVLSRLINTH